MNRAVKAILAGLLCYVLLSVHLMCADSADQSDSRVSAHHTVRDLEMEIALNHKSRIIQLSITNHSPEKRFIVTPLDLTLFRIRLSDENGRPLKMTARGVQDLTEPAIGSVRTTELRNGNPVSDSIDLSRLFEFPQKGEVRCEVSRLVHFTEPMKQHPAEKEWVKFPPVTLVIGEVASPPIQPTAKPRAK